MLTSIDPRTGAAHHTGIPPSTDDAVAGIVPAAHDSWRSFSRRDRPWRAGLLDALADALQTHREDLAAIADRETGLGVARLLGEVDRSAFQLRLFADVVRDGAYLEAAVDHAAQTPLGAAPDVRRLLVSLGVVAVFGSSNFPFAFSVAGGDVASALAAGNAVVIKAHSSHVETSARTWRVLTAAASAYGAPDGIIGIVYGTAAGRALVAHPLVRAAGFTGSLSAARALLDVIDQRAEPIPFYGELSSLNPFVVTEGAASARGDQIAAGLSGSFTLGAGQFCTKPGIVFVPRSDAGEAVLDGLCTRVSDMAALTLLNERIATSFDDIVARLGGQPGVQVAARGQDAQAGFAAAPTVLVTDAAALTPDVAEEAFGPLVVVVRYDEVDDIVAALDAVPGSLTATIHAEPDETELSRDLVAELAPRVGRIVFNGYPTGVRVSWSQHHGGPWPATNSLHTSVGATAIRRFLRPIAFQDAPEAVLPEELRDAGAAVPRRVDGILRLS